MSTLRDLVEEHTALGPADIDHLHRLAGDWQLISDLSFADLLLWVPVDPATDPAARRSSASPRCARPPRPPRTRTTRSGGWSAAPEVAHLAIARQQGRIWREGDPVWYGDTPARHEAVPVRRRRADGETSDVIAVVGRDTNLSTARTPSQLELNYLTSADDLAQMVADGTFPPPRHAGETTSAPRVGDGLVRLDGGGKVTYAVAERPVRVPAPRVRLPPRRRGSGGAARTGWPTIRWRAPTRATRILASLRGDAPAAQGDRGPRRRPC